MTQKQFWAVGGVFTDGSFSTLERDGAACFGPFATREQAESAATSHTRHNIDICWYKLFVAENVLPLAHKG